MSRSLEHNQIPFDKIEKYVLGKLSAKEKHALELQALEDPFLQDAIDGYIANPKTLHYFKQHKTKFKTNKVFKSYLTVFGILFFLIGGALYLNNQSLQNKTSVDKKIVDNTFKKHAKINTQKEFEIIPQAIDTLIALPIEEQINQTEISLLQNNKKSFEKQQSDAQKNDFNTPPAHIDLIDVNDDLDEDEEIINPITVETIKIYPFVYFYDLSVVDYTKYENRTKTIEKVTYTLSGTEAMFENQNSKQTSELVEKKLIVPYMNYLEETMYYFSKGKYKNALKRFEIIKQQYTNDLNALFYGGLSNFNLARFNKALNDFTKIIDLNNNPFYEDALWYRAKTYHKLNQNNKALQDLETLVLVSKYYQKQAVELIKIIKKQ
ncbi:MAG TPA: hypothetical protein EYG85_00740 [Crocinitomix sp.]|nr:hypothetical protein [Crocinitomix sp.]